ncbi:MerR family transcriptional regulator [Microlunatus parietis]|uniref:DNA-binding transcriptional MerR regulator n=1 Tax=Microlunatus parietis TaxID=682979 RepID=A0A7Y9I6K8_9ACTN|nr:MerR family transcriptional regulator [Microlunatus parietis]NYE71227.1 DNA-binding transcriptional MerR regulator [Microlunatus parietis]
MRIGELATRTGASVRSIRYYESQGLLEANRTSSGQRVFDARAVERVALIRRLLDAGLGSRAILDVLPCLTDPTLRTPYLARRLGEERARILAEADQLTRTAAALERVIVDLAAVPEKIPSDRQGIEP